MFHFIDSILPTDADPLTAIPSIYEGSSDMIPEGFNSVSMTLDGCMDSDLNWKEAINRARKYAQQGIRLFWNLDLGLFDCLKWPLSDQTQYMALSLAVKHFREVIWKEFHDHSVGVSLYRGTADFYSLMPWDVELRQNLVAWLKDEEDHSLLHLFCRDTLFSYIHHLAQQLTSDCCASILLDTHSIRDPILLGMILSREQAHGLIIGITDESWLYRMNNHGCVASALVSKTKNEMPKLGVCLPAMKLYCPKSHQRLKKALQTIDKPFRFVSETYLTAEWENLDELIVLPEWLSEQGKRKLQGFEAASGKVTLIL